MSITFGSLFAGIGGFDLGLERAGMECRWQVEIDPYASQVLARHWPHVRRHDDIRTFPTAGENWSVDLICGGFPCQDISTAGKRAGIHGERSGLFFEALRVACELKPRYLLLENVPALLFRGMGAVLSHLAESGFDAEWQVLPAAAFGAPHLRERVFIVAYSTGLPLPSPVLQTAPLERLQRQFRRDNPAPDEPSGTYWQADQPCLSELDDGVPGWASAVKGLGNAIVPQVAEYIGQQIMRAHNQPRGEVLATPTRDRSETMKGKP